MTKIEFLFSLRILLVKYTNTVP